METKKPILVLKERRGGTPPELTERLRRQRKLVKAIRAELSEGPRTVPELAEAIGEPSHEVLWMLMALKKYGEVEEGAERDSYFEYSLPSPEAER